MELKYHGVVVSHTHWDREWYVTFEEFRARLIETIDELLAVLDEEPRYRCFTLDGQMSIVEDYLDVKPEAGEKLESYIRAGRILIGPWYILPDEYLVSDEALVRNLLIGDRMSRKFGSKMPVCYMPDIRCQISQMPQIMKGFGLEAAVMGRGVGYQASKSEWYWKGSDDSVVLGIYMPRGYSNAGTGQLPEELDVALERLSRIADTLIPYATTRYLLLMNGGDHLRAQKFLPDLLDQINQTSTSVKLMQGSLLDYINAVKDAGPELFTLTGEFLYGRPNRICPGVWSSRLYLKQQNNRCQFLLERYAEPASTFAWLLGRSYPGASLLKAWKYLIQNHTHDSISACGTDEVHRDMERRFSWVDHIGNWATREGLTYIAGKVDTSSVARMMDARLQPTIHSALMVFNPGNRTRTDRVRATVILPVSDRGKNSAATDGPEISIIDSKGEAVPYHIVAMGPFDQYVPGTREQGNTYVVEFLAKDIPAYGYSTYLISNGGSGHYSSSPAEKRTPDSSVGTGASPTPRPSISNEYFEVWADPENGALNLLDKASGVTYSGLNVFEDIGDVGDEYNFDPIPGDVPFTTLHSTPVITKTISPVGEQLAIEYNWQLPASCANDRLGRSKELVSCPIRTEVTLVPHVRRVDIRTIIENKAEDHLLEVIFPTGMNASSYFVEAPFDVVERPVAIPEMRPDEKMLPGQEVYDPFRPQRTFLCVESDGKGLAVLNKGCTNYRMRDKGDAGVEIALTLIRAVGWLSREDLHSRIGNAGPNIRTPEAQCLGRRIFEYALVPYSGTFHDSKVQQLAHEFNAPPVGAQTSIHDGDLPHHMSFLKVVPDDLIITAIKQSEEGQRMVIRCYNPSNKTCTADILTFRQARSVRLLNLNEEELDIEKSGYGAQVRLDENGAVHVSLAPKKILTLGLEF